MINTTTKELFDIKNKIIKEYNKRSNESNVFRLNNLNSKLLAKLRTLNKTVKIDKAITKASGTPLGFIGSLEDAKDIKSIKKILKENNSKLRKLKN